MITKIYRVKGTFVMGDEYHKFTKEYKASINRNQISIAEITEISPEEVLDPIVKEIL